MNLCSRLSVRLVRRAQREAHPAGETLEQPVPQERPALLVSSDLKGLQERVAATARLVQLAVAQLALAEASAQPAPLVRDRLVALVALVLPALQAPPDPVVQQALVQLAQQAVMARRAARDPVGYWEPPGLLASLALWELVGLRAHPVYLGALDQWELQVSKGPLVVRVLLEHPARRAPPVPTAVPAYLNS